MNADDLDALEETLAILGDPEAMAELREVDEAYASGDIVRGIEAVQALRPG